MHVFDLHCDTLYRAITEKQSIVDNNFHISINRGLKYSSWTQCMAIWISDDIRGQKAFNMVEQAHNLLTYEEKCNPNKINIINKNSQHQASDKANVIFTVEGGAALAGDINNVEKLKNFGVKMLTLTWNGKNELGDGIGVENGKGLTPFGIKALSRLESNGIIVDVSHSSDKMFYDVAENSTRPFVVSHSNSRKICSNERNLTDEQFKIIVNNGGIVGLNFCIHFLNNNSNGDIYDILRHTEHFLSLGGESTVALGTDYDGTDVPKQVDDITKLENLYELFLKENYSESLVNNIFYNNAYNFTKNFDN